MGAAGDDDVQARHDAGVEERCRLCGECSELDELAEAARLDHELADVDGAEPSGDPVEYDVQPVSRRQHRVNEGRRQIEPTARRLQHAFDQIAHLGSGQDRGGELVATVAGDEDALRFVDPNLFDARVVEVALQRAEAGDSGDELVDDLVGVGDRPHNAGQAALIVRAYGGPREPAYGLDVGQRVDTASTHLFTDVEVQRVNG